MKVKPLPPVAYLHECFKLSSESPSGLIWKTRPISHSVSVREANRWNSRHAGKPAGKIWTSPSGSQYYQVKVSCETYYSHRIVFSMYHNKDISTDVEVDHRDGNGCNNEPRNLRLATRSNNNHNRRLYSNNTSQLKGVRQRKDNGLYCGQVRLNGKAYHTGFSPSKTVILDLVRDLREKLHGEFTNHGNE